MFAINLNPWTTYGLVLIFPVPFGFPPKKNWTEAHRVWVVLVVVDAGAARRPATGGSRSLGRQILIDGIFNLVLLPLFAKQS